MISTPHCIGSFWKKRRFGRDQYRTCLQGVLSRTLRAPEKHVGALVPWRYDVPRHGSFVTARGTIEDFPLREGRGSLIVGAIDETEKARARVALVGADDRGFLVSPWLP